jgi:hypothetical protein
VATLWTLLAADSPAAGDRKVQQAVWVALLEHAAQGVIEIFTHLPLGPTPATSDVPFAPVCPSSHLVDPCLSGLELRSRDMMLYDSC